MEPEEFGKLVGRVLRDPKKLYILSLVLIVLFPPINRVPSTRAFFEGWHFISKLGGIYHINMSYIAIEFAIVTIAFLLFRKK